MTNALVGIDLETGGLDGYVEVDGQRVHGAAYYPILEIGVVVTLSSLDVVDEFAVGIRQSQESIDKMHPWAKEQHDKSGLLAALERGEQHDFIADTLSEASDYIIKRLNAGGAKKYDRKARTGSIMFGNSIAFDMNYLNAQMPELASHFHYRKIDISVIDMLSRTTWKGVGFEAPEKQYGHTALADIKESLAELRSYTNTLQPLIDRVTSE